MHIAGLVRVQFDRAQPKLVVQGLLSNVLKYGLGTWAEVHVKQTGSCACLTVGGPRHGRASG
jgi:signal transduction histidine kinase